jgi:hypothetical protein
MYGWKKNLAPRLLFACCLLSNSARTCSWGFFAHEHINEKAIYTLPQAMLPFFKNNVDFLVQHASHPDKRRYAVVGESPKHYIDLEHYGEEVPTHWREAEERYGEKMLSNHGILPWHIYRMTFWLTNAFKEGDAVRTLRLLAEIAHYIADANVPLHTTANHDGQLTGQHGIHGLWESRIPELFAEDYDFWIGKATYLQDMQQEVWQVIHASHQCSLELLEMERTLDASFPTHKKYSFEQRGKSMRKVYAYAYAKAFEQGMEGMVEARLRAAIQMVGSIWYTCWINAGQPDLINRYGEEPVGEQEIKAAAALPKVKEKLKLRRCTQD